VVIPSGVQESQSLIFQNAYTLSGSGGLVNKTGNITVNSGITATVSVGLNGNMGFHKLGAGTRVLNPPVAMQYQGTATVDDGVLEISADSNFGFTSNTVTINAATLRNRITLGEARAVTLGAAGAAIEAKAGTTFTFFGAIGGSFPLIQNGGGTLLLAFANTYSTGTFINAGAVSISTDNRLGAAGTPVTMSGGTLATTPTFTLPRPVTLSGGGGTFDVASGTNLTASGVFSGTRGLAKVGAGTLTLTTANTYTGGTIISAGTLSIDAANRLDTGALALSLYGGTLATTATFTLSKVIDLNTFSGTINTASGTTLTAPGPFLGNAGSGSLIKMGSGTLSLTGANGNLYSGLTTVNEGTLRLGKSSGNAVPSNLSIGDGSGGGVVILDASEQIATANVNVFHGVFNLNGFNETIASLTMSAGQVIGNGGTLTLTAGPVSTFASTAAIDCNLNLGGGQRSFSVSDGLPALDLTVSGVISNGALAKSGGGTMLLAGNNTYTGATTVTGGSLILDQSLTTTSSVSITNPNVSIVLSAAGGNHVIKTGPISIAGRVDLKDNKLITTSPVGVATGNTYGGVTRLIQTGRNGGNWSGNGIVTSQTDATTSNFTSIGIATAAQAKGVASTDTVVWAGQTVAGSDTLVMYTYGGDANLDGKLNVDDYGRIDTNIGLGTAGWYNGDFNYDGKVNVDDYGILDGNIGTQGPQFPTAGGVGFAATAVPEPAAGGAGIVAATSSVLGLRRRRSRA
jgi:autotransporter-associated beta strand protein